MEGAKKVESLEGVLSIESTLFLFLSTPFYYVLTYLKFFLQTFLKLRSVITLFA